MSKQKIDRENAIQKLEQANDILREALLQIKEINKEEQFDFCTSSKLAEVVCGSENLIEEISKIVFQRDRKSRRR